MWTENQRKRLAIEHQILQREQFSQFCVYHSAATNGYYAFGRTTSSFGKAYCLWLPIPLGFPTQRPPLYILNPCPLLMADGAEVSHLGVSHSMHTLAPHAGGYVQILHWPDARWHAGIVLQKVFLKAQIWIEAFEQHLATGRPLAEFVRPLSESSNAIANPWYGCGGSCPVGGDLVASFAATYGLDAALLPPLPEKD